MSRPDTVVQAEQPEPRDIVGRVGDHAQRREEVADVGGLGEPQAAVLDERDAAGRELDLEHVTVVRGAHEHGLVAQVGAGLVGLEHAGADLARLGGLVVAADERGGQAGVPAGGQREFQAGRLRPDGVSQGQHRLPGPVVPGQPEHGQAGNVGAQPPQVPRIGAAEAVDRLCVVAHAGQPRAVGLEQPDDVGLHGVDVLVLVDQDRVEHAAQRRARRVVGQRGAPEQQQVVEVDQLWLRLWPT